MPVMQEGAIRAAHAYHEADAAAEIRPYVWAHPWMIGGKADTALCDTWLADGYPIFGKLLGRTPGP